ncbi:MAG TPA: SAM-dependent methyltransferase [Bacteroidales bacterium]|nr:SAM-dependent methyltransferase [Bacteroidales bacterium]HNW68285.1 SAM-dependent methyltransferase [Bacteroidales bacterium]HPT52713.1 SAM-dependent methyltransferase [Bacteroidales bacterium]
MAKLYLIPSPLGECDFTTVFPAWNSEIIQSIDTYIVEDVRTERRFLKKLGIRQSIDDLTFYHLDKHSKDLDLRQFLAPCLAGKNVGLLSDAGVPCIADPGNLVVATAHRLGIPVVPLVGPSSILLALMASGFNAQSFAFHGYLPSEQPDRERELKFLESLSDKTHQTQIFIETPYRNNHIFKSILSVCAPDTRLCIAVNLTTEDETIISKTIAQWKKEHIDLHKKPAIFLISR